MSKIDHTFNHDQAADFWAYLVNFLKPTEAKEQIFEELRRLCQTIAFHEAERYASQQVVEADVRESCLTIIQCDKRYEGCFNSCSSWQPPAA